MKHLKQKEHFFTIDQHNTPIIKITSGETIIAETPDNTGNNIKKEEDLEKLLSLNRFNPLVGPIYVEGANVGDTLVIDINKIEILFGQGWGGKLSGGISLPGNAHEGLYLISDCHNYKIKIYEIKNETIKISLKNKKDLLIPAAPFIGTIGTAPEIGSFLSTSMGNYGGNMDSQDVCVGNKLFLPVFVEGGFLYFGDAHALQGDGELNGPPVEISSRCTLTISVIKNKKINWPRIETSDYIMTVGNSCPLDNALRIACSEMIYWLKNEYSFDLDDAILLSTTLFRSRINSAGNINNNSVTISFPKKYL